MAVTRYGLGSGYKGTDSPDESWCFWLDESTSPPTPKLQYNDGGTGSPLFVTLGGGGGSDHNLLDGDVHPDTVADDPVRGDLIVAQSATPKWERLAKGTIGHVLTMNSNEPQWNIPQDASTRYQGRFILIGYVFGFTGVSGSPFAKSYGATTLTNNNGSIAITSDFTDSRALYRGTTTVTAQLRSGVITAPDCYPYFRAYVRLDDNADGNMWIGLADTIPPATADPGAIDVVAFRARNGTDTNWQALTSEQAGGTDGVTDTGVAIDTEWHVFEITCEDGTGTQWDFYIDGVNVASRTGSTLPLTTSQLNCVVGNVAISSSTREFSIKSLLLTHGDPLFGLEDILAPSYI